MSSDPSSRSALPPSAPGPWRAAARRLRRDRVALGFAAVLAAVVLAAIAAPLWAAHVADTGPATTHLTDTVVVDGERRDVVALDGTPIGPTWQGRYLLGADESGRDVLVRLLYAARNSLLIGFGAAALTALLACAIGLVAGVARGWVDALVLRVLDVIWSFPVLLFGIALGTVVAVEEVRIGPLGPEAASKLLTTLVIGVISVPYLARPVRARVLALRDAPFVEAAVALGAGRVRVALRELLPNVTFTVLGLFAVLVANAIVLESALAFLGAGVRDPEPSWGTMIRTGLERVTVAPHLLVVPSVALALTVLCVTLVGDGVRRALDPHAAWR